MMRRYLIGVCLLLAIGACVLLALACSSSGGHPKPKPCNCGKPLAALTRADEDRAWALVESRARAARAAGTIRCNLRLERPRVEYRACAWSSKGIDFGGASPVASRRCNTAGLTDWRNKRIIVTTEDGPERTYNLLLWEDENTVFSNPDCRHLWDKDPLKVMQP